VYFPALGSFEIFVDEVLVFSKLKSGMWPHSEKVSKTIMAMLEAKKEGKDLSTFDYVNSLEEQERNKFQKMFKKRNISKTPQKERNG
jgi:ferritin